MRTTGLFQIDLYQIEEVVPAQAELVTDPLGQVIAVISAYLPEGFGSDLHDWQETAYLRADFARQRVELIRKVEGELSVEGEWALDVQDDDVLEHLLPGPSEPDAASFGTLASCAPDLHIAPPGPDIRGLWGEDTTITTGVPDENWAGPDDE